MPNMLADAAQGGFQTLALKENPVSGFAGYDPGVSGTIQAGPPVQRLVLGSSRSSCVMALPSGDAAVPQMVMLINESASNTLTFATAATSNVANGTSCVISALAAIVLVYDDNTKLWYQVRAA